MKYFEMKNTACTPNGEINMENIAEKANKQVAKFFTAEKTMG